MRLPFVSGPATQWVLYDYGRTFVDSDPAAGGQAIAIVATVPGDELWMIDLVRVKTTDEDTPGKAYVCMGDPSRDVSGTETGGYDVADQASPIQAPANTEVLIVWKGLADGLVGNAYVQWTRLKSASTVGA